MASLSYASKNMRGEEARKKGTLARCGAEACARRIFVSGASPNPLECGAVVGTAKLLPRRSTKCELGVRLTAPAAPIEARRTHMEARLEQLAINVLGTWLRRAMCGGRAGVGEMRAAVGGAGISTEARRKHLPIEARCSWAREK
eukprot:6195948-Pleurochrysis_carterae.AAC.1